MPIKTITFYLSHSTAIVNFDLILKAPQDTGSFFVVCDPFPKVAGLLTLHYRQPLVQSALKTR